MATLKNPRVHDRRWKEKSAKLSICLSPENYYAFLRTKMFSENFYNIMPCAVRCAQRIGTVHLLWNPKTRKFYDTPQSILKCRLTAVQVFFALLVVGTGSIAAKLQKSRDINLSLCITLCLIIDLCVHFVIAVHPKAITYWCNNLLDFMTKFQSKPSTFKSWKNWAIVSINIFLQLLQKNGCQNITETVPGKTSTWIN